MKITIDNIQDVFKSKKADIDTLKIKGYTLLKECFCDNSGLNSEAGLNSAMLSELTELLKENKQVYTFITSVGQFQVYIGIFIKQKKEFKSRIIARNTLEYFRENKRVIRFHNTDIIEFSENEDTVKLFNGGFYTRTTKDRLNSILSQTGFYIYQQNGKWYILKRKENSLYSYKPSASFEFSEGITLLLN